MISSPCKECPKVDKPKDQCVKKCPLIQGVQDIAIGELQVLSTAIDYSDDVRFSIPPSLARSNPAM